MFVLWFCNDNMESCKACVVPSKPFFFFLSFPFFPLFFIRIVNMFFFKFVNDLVFL